MINITNPAKKYLLNIPEINLESKVTRTVQQPQRVEEFFKQKAVNGKPVYTAGFMTGSVTRNDLR